MEIIYVNPDDIYPFQVYQFNTLIKKFFSFKNDAKEPSSIAKILKKTLEEKIAPYGKGCPLDHVLLMAHVAYVTKGNLRTSVHEFSMSRWVYQLYVPKENCKYFVPSSTLVSDWDSIIKEEYPDLEYVTLEDFWNLFSNNQIRYVEKGETGRVVAHGAE